MLQNLCTVCTFLWGLDTWVLDDLGTIHHLVTNYLVCGLAELGLGLTPASLSSCSWGLVRLLIKVIMMIKEIGFRF